MKNLLATLLLSALISLPVFAKDKQEFKVEGFYLGSGLGSSNIYNSGDAKWTVNDSSVRFYGGYQFNEIVGVETDFTRFGSIVIDGTDAEHALWTSSVAANLGYTFPNRLRLFSKLGLSLVASNPISNDDIDIDTLGLKVGFGLEYALDYLPRLNLRLAYENDFFAIEEKVGNSTNDEIIDVSSFYLGASYKF